MTELDVRDQAVLLWQRGLNVIPIPRPRPGVPAGQPGDGKVPALAWKTWQITRQTEADVRAFDWRNQNIAIITGDVSGVVVIDADSPAALRWCTAHLPYTAWQTATRQGFHLFYRHPADLPVGNRARLETRDGKLAIDVRGDGGYVVAPGSMHASGSTYCGAGDWTVAREALPRFWPGWVARPNRPQASRPRPASTTAADVRERARRYLAAVPRPEIGQGSDAATLYAACRLVRGFGLAEYEAGELLWDWAGGRSGWTRAYIDQKVDHAMKYGTEPIGAMR